MTLSFLKTSGTKVVNEANEEVILCGVGLGNWMLKEGYMWLFGETDKDRGRRIEAFIEELIGKEDANLFWETYYATYTTEQDVKIISDLGFNSIRLPIHYRFIQDEEGNFIEERVKVIDDFIAWCETYNVYVILDLHGAPGGQTGANIDDSEHDFPELFTMRKYQLQTINLWKMLAKRYVGNKVVAGYDLLNEPLPSHFSQFNDELVKFYDELIAEVRAIDPDHIIILEGANWANDWSIFTKPYENVMLQAHKYWNNPDFESIQKFITIGNELNCPIWLGETGENTTDWFVGSFQLQADYGIGWNLWPHKRMGSPRNPFTIKTPAGWDRIISIAKGESSLTKDEATVILDEFLHNIKIENCVYNEAVVNSVLKVAPLKIPAEFFNYKGEGISYHSESPKEHEIQFRCNDNVKIKFLNKSAVQGGQYQVNHLLTDALQTYVEKNLTHLLSQTHEPLNVQTKIFDFLQHVASANQIASHQLEAFHHQLHEVLSAGETYVENEKSKRDAFFMKLKRAYLNYWHSRSQEEIENEQLVVELSPNEWVAYEVNIKETRNYEVVLKGNGAVGTVVKLAIASYEISKFEINELDTSLVVTIPLTKGKINIKIEVMTGIFDLDYLEIK